MLFSILLKNLLILLKNLTSIRDLISNKKINKNVFLLCFIIFIKIYISPNTAFCDSINPEVTEETFDSDNGSEQKKPKNDRVGQFFLLILGVGILFAIYLYFFDFMPPDLPSDLEDDPFDVIKPEPKDYVLAPVRDTFILRPLDHYIEMIDKCPDCGTYIEPGCVEYCDDCRFIYK